MQDENDDLDSMFDEGTQAAEEPTDAPVEPTTEPAEPAEEPKGKPVEEPAKEEPAEEKPAEEPAPEEPPKPEEKPLTAEEVRSIISDLRVQERENTRSVETLENEILKAYYPDGLSNVLIDEKTGKELRVPQDVVDLTDGEMSIEQASSWLMNKQYELNQQVNEIKQSAREIAEVNANFTQGGLRVLEQYQDIFTKYPQIQRKVYDNYMKAVTLDEKNGYVLKAPDIEDYYRDFMEPYVMALRQPGTTQPATAPAAPEQKIPESKQTAADRMDVSGDAGVSTDRDADPNDPNANLDKLFGE